MNKSINIAIVGNPNSGKTTIFNALTGARQHVGNYPGVTVEKKEGVIKQDGLTIKIVDLPGIYSLSARSEDERIARDYILLEKPDVVIDVIDSSNLERNLYLTIQLIELGAPLVLAFNMSDVVESLGKKYDIALLSQLIGAPVIETVGSKAIGISTLIKAAIDLKNGGNRPPEISIDYGNELNKELDRLETMIEEDGDKIDHHDSRWLALKLLEKDKYVVNGIQSGRVLAEVETSRLRIEKLTGLASETLIVDRRYGFITGAVQEATLFSDEDRRTLSDKIDSVMTHRLFGLPIFFGLMYLVFNLTFTLGSAPMEWIAAFFNWAGSNIEGLWPVGVDSPLKSLILDGIIGGVGGVIVFLPNILLLFSAIAILEDSGYMPRTAFMMDRFMHKLGLHGKSFIPMLIGFGCTVPAIMATRTLENKRDRLITMLIAPLMSCGARLPIYVLIIPAFFPLKLQGLMIWMIYVIGIALAVISSKLLRVTMFKGPSTSFVMELPPYRMPTVRGVLVHMWERGWLYLKKAGTIILGVSIILWALTSYPKKDVITSSSPDEIQAEILAYSYAGRMGDALEPIIRPMGFDWRIGTALIGAFAAKEVFVAQMGIVFSVGETSDEPVDLRDKLQRNYTPLTGFCIMLFMLISAPCMATIAVTRRESNSWGIALLQLGGLTLLGYIITVFVFQVGKLFGIGI